MNINNFRQNPKTKYIFYLILLLPFILIPILLTNTKLKTKVNNATVPLIPSTSPKNTTDKANTNNYQNPFGSEQKVVFSWEGISPDLPSTIDGYKIITPIINTSTIISLASKFKFSPNDKSKETTEGSDLWINKSASLFGSTKQNQISYFYTTEIPKHTTDLTASDSIDLAKLTLLNLFGENFVNSLDNNPEVLFFNQTPDYLEDLPNKSTERNNNIVTINYKQNINESPVLSRSKNGEILSISFDTTKKLYFLNLYGGFESVTKTETFNSLSFSDLQKIANDKAIRITQAKDMSSERALTDAKTISIKVKTVYPGYFQNDNNSLYPVIFIDGTMSTDNVEDYPATYIVPANKN